MAEPGPDAIKGVNDLLDFLEAHTMETMLYTSETLTSQGCDGTPGGCCSKVIDVSDVIDLLYSLAKRERP